MLTNLATVKSWLGITDTASDAQLTTLIAGVDEQVKRYCARNFERGTVAAKLLLGREDTEIVLDETPVEAILYCAGGRQQAVTISYPTGNFSAYITTNRTGTTTLRLVAGMVAADVAIIITDTLADLATKIAAAGWTATVADGYDDYPAHCLLDQETADGEAGDDLVLYGALTRVLLQRAEAAGVYRLAVRDDYQWRPENYGIDSDSEIRRVRPLVVIYTGGYQAADIPAGLTLIVIKICCDAWRTFGQAAGMKSERVGDYAYDKFDSASIASAVGPYMSALDQYRRV